MIVKSRDTYTEFQKGRDLESAVHMEDESAGFCMAYIDDAGLKPTDVVIDQAEYDALVAECKTYNTTHSLPVIPITNIAYKDFLDWLTEDEQAAMTAAISKIDLSTGVTANLKLTEGNNRASITGRFWLYDPVRKWVDGLVGGMLIDREIDPFLQGLVDAGVLTSVRLTDALRRRWY